MFSNANLIDAFLEAFRQFFQPISLVSNGKRRESRSFGGGILMNVQNETVPSFMGLVYLPSVPCHQLYINIIGFLRGGGDSPSLTYLSVESHRFQMISVSSGPKILRHVNKSSSFHTRCALSPVINGVK